MGRGDYCHVRLLSALLTAYALLVSLAGKASDQSDEKWLAPLPV